MCSLSMIIRQQLLGLVVTVVDDGAHFFIDTLGRLRRIDASDSGPRSDRGTPLRSLSSYMQRPKLLGQTPLGHHTAGQIGGALDIVGGAGGHAVEAQGQLLGDTAAEQTADLS